MQENKDQIFDKKTVLAIILAGAVFFGWQSYLTKKYPAPTPSSGAAPSPDAVTAAPTAEEKVNSGLTAPTPPIGATTKETNPPIQENLIDVNLPWGKLQLSSLGMGLKNVVLTQHTNRDNEPILLGESGESLFALKFMTNLAAVPFVITSSEKNIFVGEYVSAAGMKIVKTLQFSDENGAIRTRIKIENPEPAFAGLQVHLSERQHVYDSGSLLMPSFEHQEFVVHHSGQVERINVSHLGEVVERTLSSVAMVAIGSQYFATAISDKSEIIPEVRLFAKPLPAENPKGATQIVSASLNYRPASLRPVMLLEYVGYAGPKSYSVLKSVDSEMIGIINFGFFSSIAKFMLVLLQWFHTFVANWGVSIILLTILVRIFVLPFNIISYKSMKKMQKIQPMIASLKERYANDPQKLNTEMMSLMRTEKVNPLGGCIPMLLQMPVFFALYQVLGQSIELYQAPFIFWIKDLSLKDPFYVLPVLMGVAMFIQQKITPTPSMDETQKKIMMFLPILFSLMMVALPSGLTLYILVSTVFGVVQQQIFMRDSSSNLNVAKAKA
jgi:YidC/Oxa1 family membrane protein insertase